MLQVTTPSTGSTSSAPTQTSLSVPPSKKRKSDPASASRALLLKATRYLEADDDEFLTLAKGYAVKLRKLTPQQLMFADKVINDALLDGQMGFLTRHSYVIHPPGLSATVSPSSTLSSLSSGAQHPSYSSSQPQNARDLLEGFSYSNDDDGGDAPLF